MLQEKKRREGSSSVNFAGRTLFDDPASAVLPVSGIPVSGICVDASCFDFDGTKGRDGYFHGKVEWRGVDLGTGELVFESGVYAQGTVNIAEWCAIVDALRWLHGRGDHGTVVYSDSKLALGWMKGNRLSSNLPVRDGTLPLIRAVVQRWDWLQEYGYENQLVWWDGKLWGENPADYGRK